MKQTEEQARRARIEKKLDDRQKESAQNTLQIMQRMQAQNRLSSELATRSADAEVAHG